MADLEPDPATDLPDGLPPGIAQLLEDCARDRVTRVRRRREQVAAFRSERQVARDAGKARLHDIKLARIAGNTAAATEAAPKLSERRSHMSDNIRYAATATGLREAAAPPDCPRPWWHGARPSDEIAGLLAMATDECLCGCQVAAEPAGGAR